MRALIERFKYRFELWQRERDDVDGVGPLNPLRFVAAVAAVTLFVDALALFVFHRPLDMFAGLRVAVEVAFIILYVSKSRWAWHVVVIWLPLAFVANYILRLAGHPRYQPRIHEPLSEFIAALIYLIITVAVLFWLFRSRYRYSDYVAHARSKQT